MKKMMLAMAVLAFFGTGAEAAEKTKELKSNAMVAKAVPIDHFAAMDEDKDGKVTLDEAKNYYRTIMKDLDADGDGFLGRDECDYGCVVFKPGSIDADKHARHGDIAREVRSRFDGMDKDKDSAISKDEYVTYFEEQFATKDTNKDRTLSKEEFNK